MDAHCGSGGGAHCDPTWIFPRPVSAGGGDADFGDSRLLAGPSLAVFAGGVLFVENIFAIPGLGTLAMEAVNNLDVPMIMGTVQLSAGLIVGSSLLVDLLNQWLDPRIEELSPR